LALHATTPTAAASVETPPMEQALASPVPDPWCVTAPLNPSQVESLLCKYDIFEPWQHIVEGLHTGFDVEIHSLPSHTYTF
jgi:hypothetical protein